MKRILITVSFMLMSSLASRAQSDFEKGFQPFNSYHINDFDSVNLANGNLLLHIPLLSYPQRGEVAPTVEVSIRSNSTSWAMQHSGTQWLPARDEGSTLLQPFGQPWITMTPGSLHTREFLYPNPGTPPDLVRHAIDASGAHHYLGWTSPTTMESIDGTGIHLDLTTGILTDKNGTTDKDTNGNFITFGPLNPNGLRGITDTLGRNLPPPFAPLNSPATSFPTPGCTTINYPGQNGQQMPYIFCFNTYPIHTSFNQSAREFSDTWTLLQSVTLPNGAMWQFTYGSFGEVQSVTLPTGATLSYTYINIPSCNQPVPPPPFPGPWAYVRGVATRTLDLHDGTPPKTWIYDGGIVTDPLGNDTVHTFTALGGSACALYETETQYFNGSHGGGTLLKTVNTQYSDAGRVPFFHYDGNTTEFGVFPILTTTTWPNGQVSQESFRYDSANGLTFYDANPINGSSVTYPLSFGNVMQTDEFAYGTNGPGARVRRNKRSYLHEDPTQAAYLNANILNRVVQQDVYDCSSGSCALAARTVNCYDQTPTTSTSGVPQHDYTNFSTSFNTRGNVTQQLSWFNPPAGTSSTSSCGQASVAGAISTTYAYDDTGQQISKTDPLGHTTSYSYHDANAYLEKIIAPAPDPTGVHGSASTLKTSFTHDFNTGLRTSDTDENGQVTNYAYTDPLNRLTSIQRPDGGSSAISYGDVPGALFIHTLTAMDGARSLETYSYFDEFGRPSRTLNFDGNSGAPWIAREAVYNAAGQVAAVTNPHHVAQPSAVPDGCSAAPCTLTTYDGLGRVTSVTTPDGQSITTAYAGSSTRVTDQAGLATDRATDAQGRLIQVTENSTNVNNDGSPVTTYAYDALNNLLCVHQRGTDATQDKLCTDSTVPAAWRPRNFSYDALSRLLTASNPESGLTQYNYDGDGNLTSKTDANNTVITTTYDGRNRPVTTTYSDGTPAVTNFYDGTGNSAPGNNPLGHLSLVSSVDLSSGNYSFDNYDAMGRVLGTTQTVDGQPYGMSYQYDLAGHLIQEKYPPPSNRVVNFTYDMAGRVSSVGAQTNQKPYADLIQYSAHGLITDLLLGNGFWEFADFDANRLQTTIIDVGSSKRGSDILSLKYDYADANGHNNGNVQRQMITAPGLAVTQLAQYDGLNRLLKVQEVSGSSVSFPFQSSFAWEQDFTHDFWGNRTSLMSTGFVPIVPTIVPDVHNRIDVTQDSRYVYDSGGHLKQEPVGSGLNLYGYDANGRLLQAQEGPAVQVFKYNGLGQRVKKISGTVATVYVHDAAGQLISEYSTVGPQNSGTRYLTQDVIGSERLVTGTDSSGNPKVVARYDFLPFGELVPANVSARSSVGGYGSSGVTRQEFVGRERDGESGLDLMGARSYSPAVGRFIQPDPIYIAKHRPPDPQLLNLYQYGRDNPLRFSDTTGLDVKLDCANVNDDQCKQIVTDLNQRRDAQFQVSRDPQTNLFKVEGNVDVSKLSPGEKALYDAITDPNRHAILTVVAKDDKVHFGLFEGHGHNKIDNADLKLLSDVSIRAAGETVAHEALEAYDSTNGDDYDAAHAYANKYFGQVTHPFRGGCDDFSFCHPAFMLRDWNFGRIDEKFQVKTILTPVPDADRYAYEPGEIVRVVKVP